MRNTMSPLRRKIEVYRLTISGLPEGTRYGTFLRDICAHPAGEMLLRSGEKHHVLSPPTFANRRLKLRFLSYTRGHRPDVIDMFGLNVQPNPLTPTQTNVEWTHALGGLKNGRFILLVERNFNGIWPSTIERYLQMVIDRFYTPEDEDGDPVTVNLELEPGAEFISRLDALDRITSATVRIVRPNPGWRDLETELGAKAGESDAKKVDITMTARRKASLQRNEGIIAWIKNAFTRRRLGYAAISGRKGRQIESFNTEKLGKHVIQNLEVDDRGQVLPDDAWDKMSSTMNNLD